MSEAYCPVHVHTSYSLLDSAIRIKELASYLKEYNFTSCAITDHGTMAGVVDFYKTMKKEGIKSLIGVEAYITNNQDNIEDNKDKTKDNYHLVLIAKDQIGYKTLLRLVSNAALHNFYYKPRINKEHLKECSGHIIATSACLVGELAKVSYLENKPEIIDFYHEIFGEDYYLEIQDWDDGTGIQQNYNRWVIDRARERHIRLVITSDAHYLKKEDHKLHEVMMAMQLGKTLTQYRTEGKMVYGPYFYVKTPDEMLRSAQELDVEEAFWNTREIAQKCNVEIELGKYYMPEFKIEEAEDYNQFLEWRKINV